MILYYDNYMYVNAWFEIFKWYDSYAGSYDVAHFPISIFLVILKESELHLIFSVHLYESN